MDSASQLSSLSYKKADVILFTVQMCLILTCVVFALINISFEWGNLNFWTVLLTSFLAYLMPSPKIKVINGSTLEDKRETIPHSSN